MHCALSLYQCIKFHLIPLYTFRYVKGRSDGRTDGRKVGRSDGRTKRQLYASFGEHKNGCLQLSHDIIDAASLLAEKLRVNVLLV